MKLFNKLPRGFQELLQLGLGAYAVVGFIAVFCNWQTSHRYDVLIVVIIGLILVFIAEALGAGFVLLVIKFLQDRSANPKSKA